MLVVAPNVTRSELGRLAVDAGAHDALESGYGATSSLQHSSGPLLLSTDGATRPAGPWLAVVDRASGAQTRLRGIVEDGSRADRVLPAATLRVETLDGTLVAEGGTRTDGAYWEFSVPVRQYIVRAKLAGFRDGCKVCTGVADEDVWCSLFLQPGDGAETCTAPPRTLDVGPWPTTSTVVDAGVDAAEPNERDRGGCAAGGEGAPISVVFLVAVALWSRRRTLGGTLHRHSTSKCQKPPPTC